MPRPGLADAIRAARRRTRLRRDAFDRLPSLSFSRLIADARCACRPARQRGSRKHDEPARAALRQHQVRIALRRREEPLVAGDAPALAVAARAPRACVFARTSEPPCFSVMPMPSSAPRFSSIGSEARIVVAREDARQPVASIAGGSTRMARSTGTLANVIVSGHCVPFSTCACRKYIAARATCAPGPGATQGRHARRRRSQGASVRPTPDGTRSRRSARRVGPANATAVNADSRHRRARTFRPCRVLRPSA